MMTIEELKEMMRNMDPQEVSKRIRERSRHYRRLGYSEDDFVDLMLPLNDELWEKVKNLPAYPSWADHLQKQLSAALTQGSMEEQEESMKDVAKALDKGLRRSTRPIY